MPVFQDCNREHCNYSAGCLSAHDFSSKQFSNSTEIEATWSWSLTAAHPAMIKSALLDSWAEHAKSTAQWHQFMQKDLRPSWLGWQVLLNHWNKFLGTNENFVLLKNLIIRNWRRYILIFSEVPLINILLGKKTLPVRCENREIYSNEK